jgi:hypothetical protein
MDFGGFIWGLNKFDFLGIVQEWNDLPFKAAMGS